MEWWKSWLRPPRAERAANLWTHLPHELTVCVLGFASATDIACATLACRGMAHQCNAVASSLLALEAHADSEPAPDLGLGHARTLSIARERRAREEAMPLAWRESLEWARATAIDGWRGVRCSGRGAVVRAIRLSMKELAGTVPPPRPLARLQSLETLDLSQNHLTGHVPVGLGELVTLRRLFLNSNRLTGAVPDSLTRLTRLIKLDLSWNQLDDPDAEARLRRLMWKQALQLRIFL